MTLSEKIQTILNQDRLSIEEYLTWYKRLRIVYKKSHYKTLLKVSRDNISYQDQKRLESEVMAVLTNEHIPIVGKRPAVDKLTVMLMTEEGKTTREIARYLDVSEATVLTVKRKMGIFGPVNRKFSDEEFVELFNQGLSQREMARRFGVSPSSIIKRKNKLGL